MPSPRFSFHGGHSGQFCRHAEASLEEVVRAACEAGLSHFGISEHMPRERAEFLYSNEQDLTPADLSATFAGYANGEFERLRERYGERLHLLKGMETEHLPGAHGEPFDEVVDKYRRRFSIEYLVGSVHHVRRIPIDGPREDYERATDACGSVVALELEYFRDLTELVGKLRPQVVGHLDLIKKLHGPGWRPSAAVSAAIDECLDAIRACAALVEINAAGWRKGLGEPYPGPDLLERIVAAGIGLTLGDDSHGPNFVGQDLDRAVGAAVAAGARELVALERDGSDVRRAAFAL